MRTHNYNTAREWDSDDEIWVATVPVLPGSFAHGETQGEALREINGTVACHLEPELGVNIPFVPPTPSTSTLKKASKVLNKTEVAHLLGVEQRTLTCASKTAPTSAPGKPKNCAMSRPSTPLSLFEHTPTKQR